MNRRFFWQVPEYIKFRVVFETDETILGATENNEYRLFRKDTNQIVFSICEAMQRCLESLGEKQFAYLPQEEKPELVYA
jgi:hemolysin-activating ACP:hemolysin acyltransferase